VNEKIDPLLLYELKIYRQEDGKANQTVGISSIKGGRHGLWRTDERIGHGRIRIAHAELPQNELVVAINWGLKGFQPSQIGRTPVAICVDNFPSPPEINQLDRTGRRCGSSDCLHATTGARTHRLLSATQWSQENPRLRLARGERGQVFENHPTTLPR
jgi:hypothetical protein